MKLFKILRDFFYKNPYFTILLTVFVAVLCFIPSEKLPVANDKTAHFLAFCTLSFSWIMSYLNYFKAGVGLSIFAVFIEVVQYLLPDSFHRSFDIWDIFADILGIGIGFAIAFVFNKIVK